MTEKEISPSVSGRFLGNSAMVIHRCIEELVADGPNFLINKATHFSYIWQSYKKTNMLIY